MSGKRHTSLSECRKFFPGCTEKEAHDLLWNATAFPFASIEHCRKQLREASIASGRNVVIALAMADIALEEAMREAAVEGKG